MPGMIVCCRRWYVSSDDWVYPSIRSVLVYGIGLVVVAIVFCWNYDENECEEKPIVRVYYIGMMVLLSIHIIVSIILCSCSMQGTMIDTHRRRCVPFMLYLKTFLFVPETIWLLLGTFWAFIGDYPNCTGMVLGTVKVLVVIGWMMFVLMLVGALIVFDPLGHRRRKLRTLSRGAGSYYMERAASVTTTSNQLWENRCKFICCCAARDENSNDAFTDIAILFTNFFEGLDLVPTDITAGLILVQYNQQLSPKHLKRTKIMARATSPVPCLKPKLSKAERKKLKNRDQRLPAPNVQLAQSFDDAVTSGNPWVDASDAYSYQRSLSAPPNVDGNLLDLLPVDEDGEETPLTLGTNTNSNNVLTESADVASPRLVSSPQPEDKMQPKPWMSIHNATHYMRFAMASYGWPLYMYSHLCCGLCKILTKCRCCCGSQNVNVHNDNQCQCNLAAIRETTGIEIEDIVYASFHNAIYQIPFYVALDHSRSAIIIAIRGTLSFRDALTDMTAESVDLNIPGVEAPCKAHKGISQAAFYVNKTLKEAAILESAFSLAPTYELIITGHSLGAGAATLLATILRPTYPKLKAFAFSPPGGLLSATFAQFTQQFVCSVVLGHDVVPRLGIVSMEQLKNQVLFCVKDCHKPKYKILASGFWSIFCGGKPKNEGDKPLYKSQQESQNERQLEEAMMTSGQSCQVSLPLFPPGCIMYIEKEMEHSTCCGDSRYKASWADPKVFDEIHVSPSMLSDHLPDAVYAALSQLADQNYNIREKVESWQEDTVTSDDPAQ